MNNSYNEFTKMVISYFETKEIPSEIEIDNFIEQLYTMPMFKNTITFEEIEKFRKEIHTDYQIKLDVGSVITTRKHIKWFRNRKAHIEQSYWERYKKYLLKNSGFPLPVVNRMDDILDEITDLVGDPIGEDYFQRRGLIIGDVQSGKTANYTGLICKSVDAGYKVVILLTGTIEKLRQQTQRRLDEGFIGKDSNALIKNKLSPFIGVGEYNRNLDPIVLTSKLKDFNRHDANSGKITLNSVNEPILFVVKKNVSTLKTLNKWLSLYNLDQNNRINQSMIMIDDEADNASINTNAEDENPTATNEQIVSILKLFKKASYVGYTATPFANIFIEPNSDHEMESANLFPKDYIYALDAPSNYIGARNIFPKDSKYHSMIRYIKDFDDDYHQHKKYFEVDIIPSSLKQAILQFLIANVIRDLRNDNTAHRTMIVNLSRFINVQNQYGDLINNYLKEIQNSVRLYSKLDFENAIKDTNIRSLYQTFSKEFTNLGYSWNEIQKNISIAIAPIQVIVVNGQNFKSLDYEENEKYGLRAIVVGGLSLSRGLTLEGLIVSYFHRNSKMYDTLMQMGRWFGYRKNYDDLCRIWMDVNNVNWYEHISEATDELKRDIARMQENGATPLEFGLRVRSDIDTLAITARNKMRTATQIDRLISLSSECIEAPKIYNDHQKNEQNLIAVENLKNAIKSANIKIEKNNSGNGTGFGYRNVSKEIILDFLENYSVSLANMKFDTETISKFIKSYCGTELRNWDIVFLNGSSTKPKYQIETGKKNIEIPRVVRKCILTNNNKIIQVGQSRIGSTTDSSFGLSKEQIDILKGNWKKENPTISIMNQKYYFSNHIKRNPLLMIYMLDISNITELNNNIDKKLITQPIVALSIGIPHLSNQETKYAKYQINLVELNQYSEYSNESEEVL